VRVGIVESFKDWNVVVLQMRLGCGIEAYLYRAIWISMTSDEHATVDQLGAQKSLNMHITDDYSQTFFLRKIEIYMSAGISHVIS
jgi:hypothetical protein